MKTNAYPYILVSLFLTAGCPAELSIVTGALERDGAALADVMLVIDDDSGVSAVTDADGAFEITDVPDGQRALRLVHESDDGSSLALDREIDVNGDVDLGVLTAPSAVSLDAPANVDHESMTLAWARPDSDDFVEYRLYRHTDENVDIDTGTLMHASTQRDALSYTDADLDPATAYFYRLYVLFDGGWTVGSPIVSATTTSDACDVPAYGATAISPTDGVTDHDPADPIIIEWTSREIPDRYGIIRDESGNFPQFVSFEQDGLRDVTYYDLQPDTTYHVEEGWICLAGAQERNVPLLQFSFKTAAR